MDYVPLAAVIALVVAVVLFMRRPLRRPVDRAGLQRYAPLLSVGAVVFTVWGSVQTVQSGQDELEVQRVLRSGDRAEAVVYKPSGFLQFGEAVTRQGLCDRARVSLEHDGARRSGFVEVAGRHLTEGDRVVVAFDASVEPLSGRQVMASVADRCQRPTRSWVTGVAVLALAGMCIALRRVAAVASTEH